MTAMLPCQAEIMNFRELGKTGTQISVLGLGTWRYQGGVEPLRTGLDLGATFIDTAEAYGTEEIVGEAIKGRRKDVFLASKISPRHFRRADVLKAASGSLGRLKTDYLDLYQLHWPNYTVPLEETMGAMETLVDCGMVRFVGVSNFMLADLKKAQKALSKHPIVSNQLRYNLTDRTIEGDLLSYCQDSRITVIAHSPLASSLRALRARDPEDVLGQLARTDSRSAAQIALNWCLAKQGVVAIPKSNSADHIRENCGAGDFELSDQELRLLDARIKFQRRTPFEIGLRGIVRHALQLTGRNQ
jgi:diketogulonate reductase-like aldo/keto reductase